MKLVDRYILRQLAGPFLFFLFVFGGILWLNQALRIIDVVVDNGQPAMVFVELSVYLLPRVIERILPIVAFAAALFLTNRLYAESEYTALIAAGQSPTSFARPFLAYGIICFVIVSAFAHYITPKSNNAFRERQYEIRQEYLSQLVKVGEFISPEKGITFYFGNVREDGLLEDILIREITESGTQITHTAPTGRLVEKPNDTKLVLIDGMLQQFEEETNLLNVVRFDSFAYDLSQFAKDVGPRSIGVKSRATSDLSWHIMATDPNDQIDAIEAQSRIIKSLFSLLMPLLGAAILFSGTFSRSGFYYRIIFAISLLVALNTLRGATESMVIKAPSLSIVLYSPVIISTALILLLILIASKGWNHIFATWALSRKKVSL